MNKSIRDYLASIGAKGGKIGGKATARNMTPAQRIARAKKAAAAREKKRKQKEQS